MNEELNINTTVFNEEYEQQQLQRTMARNAEQRQAAEVEKEAATAAPEPAAQTEEKEEEEGNFLGGALEYAADNSAPSQMSDIAAPE